MLSFDAQLVLLMSFIPLIIGFLIGKQLRTRKKRFNDIE
jgi:hypothetical protein